MDKQNFELQDRYPLSTQSLTFMQDMILAASKLALIGGDNYILSGCKAAGGTVTDGIIVINGEVMPFKGGAIINTITIVEEQITVSANGLTFDKARTKRYAKFASGSGVNYYPWANFKRLSTNKQLEEAKATVKYVDDAIAKIQAGSIPKGVIVMWGGEEAAIPAGWCLCDGRTLPDRNKIPDLRGRFIVGYNSTVGSGYDKIRGTGGSASITLKPENLPKHNHKSGVLDDEGKIFLNKVADSSGASNSNLYSTGHEIQQPKYQAVTDYWGGNAAGGVDPVDIRPPYYVLAYIIKL